jgi:hypothetical protein
VATLRHAYQTQRDSSKNGTDIDQVITRLGTLAMEEVLSQVGRLA